MSYLLELLGKNLDRSLMSLVLPVYTPLTADEVGEMVEILEKEPHHIAHKLCLAIHYAHSGVCQKAEQLFSELIENNPRHLDAYLAWAASEALNGSLDKAIEKLQQGRKFYNNESRILFGLGYCHERKGQINEALNFYHTGIHAKPNLRQIRERIGAICLYKKEYGQAIEQCLALQEEHPEDVWICLVLGQLYLQTREYSDAIVAFEKALTIEPDNFDDHDDEIEQMISSGQVEEAIEKMQQVIEEEQGSFPDSYVRLADICSQVGNDDWAINNYQKAMELHPGFLEAAVKLGTQHMRMQRYYEAACMFNCAIEINDRIIAAYTGLAVAQKCSNKPQQANDTFELAGALEPNTNLLFAEMNRLQVKVAQTHDLSNKFNEQSFFDDSSKVNLQTDPLEKQLDRYENAIQKNPNQADLHYHYALLLRGKGQGDEAAEHFQSAVTINPSYQKAHIKLALLLKEKGKTSAAHEHFLQGLLLDQEHSELHYKLGLMYCDKIQFSMAVEHFASTDENENTTDNIHSNLMLALQNMALVDRASATWRAVCELNPQSTMAFLSQRSISGLKPFIT